jgi:hypothetical protein
VLKDGRRVDVRVDHAIGSVQNPLSDAQLEAKFAALVVPVLGAGPLRRDHQPPAALAWPAADMRTFVALCRPEPSKYPNDLPPLRIGILNGDDIGHEIVPASVAIAAPPPNCTASPSTGSRCPSAPARSKRTATRCRRKRWTR